MCFSSHLNYFSSCPQPVQRLYVVSRLHTSHAGTPAFKRLFLNRPVCSHGHYSLRRAWQSCPSREPRISDNKHRQLCQRAADTLVRLIHLPLSSRVFQRGRSSSVSGRSPLLSRPKDQNTTLSGSSPCTGDLGILKLHPTARSFSVVTPTALSCVSFDCCLCSSGRCLMHMHGNRLLPAPQRNAAIESFFHFIAHFTSEGDITVAWMVLVVKNAVGSVFEPFFSRGEKTSTLVQLAALKLPILANVTQVV